MTVYMLRNLQTDLGKKGMGQSQPSLLQSKDGGTEFQRLDGAPDQAVRFLVRKLA